MRNRKGFTLIELLVVVAIIAILAAILFPVFARARERARAAACLSNLRQFGTAFAMYLSEYDDLLPIPDINWATNLSTFTGGSSDLNLSTWNGYDKSQSRSSATNRDAEIDYLKGASILTDTLPYLKNYKVYGCPSFPRCTPGQPKTYPSGSGAYWTSYEYNERLVASWAYNMYNGSATAIALHSRVCLALTASNSKTTASSYDSFGRVWSAGEFGRPAQVITFREKDPFHDYRRAVFGTSWSLAGDTRKNFVFLDGHAGTFPTAQAMTMGVYEVGGGWKSGSANWYNVPPRFPQISIGENGIEALCLGWDIAD